MVIKKSDCELEKKEVEKKQLHTILIYKQYKIIHKMY